MLAWSTGVATSTAESPVPVRVAYQLALRTPGSSRTATARGSRCGRGRSGAGTRASGRTGRSDCACRTSNFGFRLLFSIMALRAIADLSLSCWYRHWLIGHRLSSDAVPLLACRPSRRRGTACPAPAAARTPGRRGSCVVTNVMSMPWIDSIIVVVDLREDHLLLDAERVVAAPVERPRAESAEVADARDRDRR